MILLPKGSPLGGGMIPVVAENERPTCSYEVPDRRYNLWSAAAGLPGALPLPGLDDGFHYQKTLFGSGTTVQEERLLHSILLPIGTGEKYV